MSDSENPVLPAEEKEVQERKKRELLASAKAKPDDAELTDDEANAMRDDLITKAKDVQKLIVTLQGNEAQLRDVVQDFVLREYAEQQVGTMLAHRVELQQTGHLQNPKYLRWAVEHKKGEYDDDRGMVSEDAFVKAEMGREQEAPLEWFDQLEVGNRPLGAKYLVDSTVPMLCKWREPSDYHKTLTEGFCLRWERELLERKMLQEEMIFFANGVPLLDTTALRQSMGLPSTKEDGSSLSLFTPSDSDGGEGGDMLLPEDPVVLKAAAKGFRSQWAAASGVNQQFFTYHNFLLFLATSKDLYSTLACSCNLDSILEPEKNTISAVKKKDFAQAALVRAFIFGGKLRALEGLEHNVDVFSALGLEEKSVVSRVEAFVASNSSLFSQRKRAVVTLLVPPSGDALVVVINVQDFTPELPFKWKFEYSDICGIGIAAPDKVVVKRTNYEAVRLVPFDDISTLVLEWVSKPEEATQVEPVGDVTSSATVAVEKAAAGAGVQQVSGSFSFVKASMVVGAVLAGSLVAVKIFRGR